MKEHLKSATESPFRDYPFLLLGVRVLWQSLLLMLVPATIALLIVVPLALQTKSASVDVHVVTHRASFTLLEGWHSGQDVELLQSVPVRRVRLSIDSLEVSAKELTDAGRSAVTINTQRIELRSRQDPHSDPWVEFKTEGDALVNQVRLTAGSKVEVAKEDDTVRLVMTPKGLLRGEISLNGPVSLIVNDYEILDRDYKALTGLEGDQQNFHLTPTASPVVFNSKERVDLELHLNGKEENFLGAFSDFLRVRELDFPLGHGETAIPIAEGLVSFRDIQKPSIELKSSFVEIPRDDVMQIVTIGAKSGALDLTASGSVSSLKTGRVPEPDNEELPNLLDWLYHDQKLGVIIGILVWVSGTVLGATKLVSTLKE